MADWAPRRALSKLFGCCTGLFSEALGGNEVPGLLWLVAPLAVALGVLGRCKMAWHSYAHRVVYGAPLAVAALVDRKLVNCAAYER